MVMDGCQLIGLLILCLLMATPAVSINWIGLHRHWDSEFWNWTTLNSSSRQINNIKSTCWSAVRQKLLTKEQVKVCLQQPATMLSVWEAGQSSSQACRQAFAERRWNCSSIDFLPRKAPDLSHGTREQAWVYALTSAALTRAVARGCSSGILKQCACGSFPRHPPDGQFKWGGCGDDIKYAKQFAKSFTDASLKRVNRKAATNLLRVSDHSESLGGHSGSAVQHWKKPHVISAVNMHNNRVGRKVAEQSLQTQCKCHGVSGSCQIKTCWRSLPPVGEIASRMKTLYGLAVEVTPRRPNDMRRRSAVASGRLAMLTAIQHHHPQAPPNLMASTAVRDGGFNEQDLIYITKSPDFCRPDKQSGSLGTAGRMCNATHESSSGSCASLCCGRGYITVIREQVERCNCKYIWCCTQVRCKTCRRQVEMHMCK
ncbi:protein Wnt-11b-2-like isoform X1 [Daphnia pulex]|uniref:protein Wnt-11b-2-like isoform X1 n=1 Tax=Daphnia pulex TaxID=6669 RepID=UPI001EDF7175|nr:protein Wnt-11b-2-like isoform X1 [Daphnia pulex]XP_046450780.1 protein Wnt-11b-2-like isoform X1 [Daphnia pulex]